MRAPRDARGDRPEQVGRHPALLDKAGFADVLGGQQFDGAGQQRGLLEDGDQARFVPPPATGGERGHGVAVGDVAEHAEPTGAVEQRLDAGHPLFLQPRQKLPGAGVHAARQEVADLRRGEQQLGGEPVRLVLGDAAARFGVGVHDQVPEFMRDVESLPVVVPFDRVEQHHRPQPAVERVRVDRGGLRRAEDHEHAVVFQHSDEVTGWTAADPPLPPDVGCRPLRAFVVVAVHRHRKARHVRLGEFHVLLQARRDVHGQLPVGERLITGELGGGSQRPEVRRGAQCGHVVGPHGEEPGVHSQAQREPPDRGDRGPFGSGLPGGDGGGAHVYQRGQLALAQAREVPGQRQAGAVEERGDVGSTVSGRRHCARPQDGEAARAHRAPPSGRRGPDRRLPSARRQVAAR